MIPLTIDRTAIGLLCRRHHVRRLSLFGSALRGALKPESDVDILVEFDPAHVPGMFALVEMESELSSMFGRKVDLRTPSELSRDFRDDVIREAEPLYEAA